jgi:hypothetical protein
MGTLIFWGVTVLGVFLGVVIISLLSMAKRTDQIYDRMYLGEEIVTPVNPVCRPASEVLSPSSSGEARLQRDLRGSVAVP